MASQEKKNNYVLTGKKCLFFTSANCRIIIVLAITRTIKYLEFVSVKKSATFLPVNNNYLLAGNKVALFFTETNSRYFITRAIARVIIGREFVEVKKGTLLPVNT